MLGPLLTSSLWTLMSRCVPQRPHRTFTPCLRGHRGHRLPGAGLLAAGRGVKGTPSSASAARPSGAPAQRALTLGASCGCVSRTFLRWAGSSCLHCLLPAGPGCWAGDTSADLGTWRPEPWGGLRAPGRSREGPAAPLPPRTSANTKTLRLSGSTAFANETKKGVILIHGLGGREAVIVSF